MRSAAQAGRDLTATTKTQTFLLHWDDDGGYYDGDDDEDYDDGDDDEDDDEDEDGDKGDNYDDDGGDC